MMAISTHNPFYHFYNPTIEHGYPVSFADNPELFSVAFQQAGLHLHVYGAESEASKQPQTLVVEGREYKGFAKKQVWAASDLFGSLVANYLSIPYAAEFGTKFPSDEIYDRGVHGVFSLQAFSGKAERFSSRDASILEPIFKARSPEDNMHMLIVLTTMLSSDFRPLNCAWVGGRPETFYAFDAEPYGASLLPLVNNERVRAAGVQLYNKMLHSEGIESLQLLAKHSLLGRFSREDDLEEAFACVREQLTDKVIYLIGDTVQKAIKIADDQKNELCQAAKYGRDRVIENIADIVCPREERVNKLGRWFPDVYSEHIRTKRAYRFKHGMRL